MHATRDTESLTIPASQPVPLTRNLADASPAQKDILRVLAYFDIFDHPLNAGEIYSFLTSNATPIEKISEACFSSVLQGIVFHSDGYFSLSSNVTGILKERREKEQRAHGYWHVAVLVARVVRHFPFVRGILISGELSKGVAGEKSDIDFFIITAENRLWICRSFFPVFKRLLPKRVKELLCFNTFIADQHLTIEERNLYAAVELVTLKPITNDDPFGTLLEKNSWIVDFLPNFAPATSATRTSSYYRPLFPRVIEFLLSSSLFDPVDRWLMNLWKKIIDWHLPELAAEKREKLFQCKPHLATGYNYDHATRILERYKQKLADLGISF